GVQHCQVCKAPVSRQSAQKIASDLANLGEGKRLALMVSLLENRKGEHRELLEDARRRGVVRLRVDGEMVDAEGLEALDKRKKHDVLAVIDRLVLGKASVARITESVEKALREGKGELVAEIDGQDRIYSEHAACCGVSYPELSPQSFSFNNPQGMCPTCSGLGTQVGIDPERLVPDPSLSIDEGAIVLWGVNVSKKDTGWGNGARLQILKQIGIPLDRPFKKLSKAHKDALFHGTGERRYKVEW